VGIILLGIGEYLVNGYWYLLMVIVLVVLVGIILMGIGEYFISAHW
jgi:hypothetical protein